MLATWCIIPKYTNLYINICEVRKFWCQTQTCWWLSKGWYALCHTSITKYTYHCYSYILYLNCFPYFIPRPYIFIIIIYFSHTHDNLRRSGDTSIDNDNYSSITKSSKVVMCVKMSIVKITIVILTIPSLCSSHHSCTPQTK